MSDADQDTVTRLLGELRAGKPDAFDDLLPLVYDELRQLARRQRHRWYGDETLTSTALVHEAYLRLVDQSAVEWESRAHFLAVASKAMRQILLDYAKRKRAAKRDGGRERIPLDEVEAVLGAGEDAMDMQSEALIALEESLGRLEAREPRQSRIVECRFFGGMTIEETAEALGISVATVKRGWAMAQAWLYRDLRSAREPSA
jgi:RNA polymerase sigma factor (TIGR02999 family)